MPSLVKSPPFTAYCIITGGSGIAVAPVVKIDCIYAKNQIPQATIVVAGGYELRSILAGVPQLSPIAYMSPRFTDLYAAEVVLGGTTLISGIIVHLSRTETGSSLHYELHINHWLDWLNYAAPHSAYSSPENPVCLTGHPFNFALPAGQLPIGGHLVSAMRHLYALGDLWEDKVKPFLMQILRTNFLEDVGFFRLPDIPQARMALSRITSLGLLPTGLLNIIPELPNVIAMLCLDLPKKPEESWGSTLWKRLVEAFGPYFMLDIIPCVHSALIVPSTPTCPYASFPILREEQLANVGARTFQKSIMFYGLYTQVQSIYGLGPGDVSATPIVGGVANPWPGTITLRRAPPILDYLLTLAPSVVYTGNVLSIGDPRGQFPIAANKGGDPATLANAAAYSMMMREFLETRKAVLVCTPTYAFRVASPGSIISFVGPYLGSTIWYGCVDAVRIMVDSESCQAQITYSLSYCRNEAENAACPDSSPLYGTYFSGAPLIA